MGNSDPTHPRQPLVIENGVIRFKSNKIVRFILESCRTGWRVDLNNIVELYGTDLFSNEDLVQFYQLIGYSVSGFGDLSLVPDEEKDAADQAAETIRASG